MNPLRWTALLVACLCVTAIHASGTQNWKHIDDSRSYVSSVAVGAGGSVIFAGRAGEESTGVTSYNAQDGSVIWSQAEPGQTMVAASAGGEVVAIVSVNENQQTILSVWTSATNGTPSWTFHIPPESVGPFGAFAPFVSSNGETVAYAPKDFDGKFPSVKFRPTIYWWNNVAKDRRPEMNKLDLTVFPGTRLGFALSGNGQVASAIVGPYIWQIDLAGFDILGQIPFKWPWIDVCLSFDGSFFAFGQNSTQIWSWNSAQRSFQSIGTQSTPNGMGFKCAFADNNLLFTNTYFSRDGTQYEWYVSAFNVAPTAVSMAWYANGPAPKSTATVSRTAISSSRDGSYVAVSASFLSTSTGKVAVFNGKNNVYTFDADGVIQSVSIVNTASGALLAIGGSSEGLLKPAVYSVNISPQ